MKENDFRVDFVNKISVDILKLNQNDTEKILSAVSEYKVFLDEFVKNFYEVENSNFCPLFKLANYIKQDNINFGLTKKEFNKIKEDLVEEIENKFNYKIEL